MRRNSCPLLLSCLLAMHSLRAVPANARPEYMEKPGEGKELVEELLARKPKENIELLGTLVIRPAEGARLEVPIKWNVRVGSNSWQDIYQTQPSGDIPAQIMVVQHADGKPNQYMFAVKTNDSPALPKPLDLSQVYQPFSGSDFWICDLGLEFLHWPQQRIIKKEMRKGRSCRVVESLNPKPAPGAYTRVLSWIDLETDGIIRAEGYDDQNKLLKDFSIKRVKKVEGRVQLKEMEITNEKTDSRTSLNFNLELEQ
jgi:hypothetical protein